MQSVCTPPPHSRSATGSPFDLDNRAAYLHWRDNKLRRQPLRSEDLIVDVGDPRALSHAELEALQQCCSDANMVVYRSRVGAADKDISRRLGTQLGLRRLDHNWLADEDGISSVTVGAGEAGEGYIPYTSRAIRWHTDGYYHPQERCIRAMILHCVTAAASGGVNRLVDHEMAYIALRDANPEWVRALMSPDAMTIPARMMGDHEEARAAQAGPVFSIDTGSGALHMRYTARTRSIEWRADEATRAAVAFLRAWLDSEPLCCFSVRLEPGMGIVAHNVLHDRSGFDDDPARPRLLYRARYLDRMSLGADVDDRVR